MRLEIFIPSAILAKLRKLAVQELRPIDLQAEYLLYKAIQQARLKPNPSHEPSAEVAHAEEA
jgi:hypothetical protein